nr:cytochrome P450 [Williamsia sp. CHRR-6]
MTTDAPSASVLAPDASIVLPPRADFTRAVQGALFLLDRRRLFAAARRRHGTTFTLDLPTFGSVALIGDPDVAKQLFLTGSDVVHNVRPNLGRVLGRESMFSQEGEAHRRQRKLLTPPLHGRRMRDYEQIIETEAARELATWPHGRRLQTTPAMMRITLNAILRAVFGADGEELEILRADMPAWIEQGSRIAPIPKPPFRFPGSPWVRFARNRRTFDELIGRLIATARADPNLAQRVDILAMMVRATYDDGAPMTDSEISDQLLTLVAAGHETTANTLAWAVERITRHPDVLARLYDEVDGEADPDPDEQPRNVLRQAVIHEVQRTRPVIDLCGRTVMADRMALGDWVFPKGTVLLVSIAQIQADEALFAHAGVFDPDRFLGSRPNPMSWLPYGGGTRRCIGAAFANMELDVVLRTLLRTYDLQVTGASDEGWHSRGIAFSPAKGGRVVVRPR